MIGCAMSESPNHSLYLLYFSFENVSLPCKMGERYEETETWTSFVASHLCHCWMGLVYKYRISRVVGNEKMLKRLSLVSSELDKWFGKHRDPFSNERGLFPPMIPCRFVYPFYRGINLPWARSPVRFSKPLILCSPIFRRYQKAVVLFMRKCIDPKAATQRCS